jgi:uncharacterized membrane protein
MAGIMLMIHKSLKLKMYNYTFWSKIIIELLKLSQEYVTVIGVYAPVEGDDEGNDKLHHDLQKIIITIKLL